MFVETWKKITLLFLFLCVMIAIAIQSNLFFSVANITAQINQKYYFWRSAKSEVCSKNAPLWLKNITKAAREGQIAGGQVAFLSSTGEIFHCEYGFSDGLEGSQPILPGTRFKFASISKIFTSESILDFIRQGKLSFSDHAIDSLPLKKDTPATDPRLNQITIKDLLTHTGGFDRDKSWDPMFMIKKQVWCPHHLEKLLNQQLDFDPGEERHYSNLGYCLLGSIISEKAQKPFPEYMAQHFNFTKYGFRYAENGHFFSDEVGYYFTGDDIPNYMNVFAFDSIQSSAGLTGTAINLVRAADKISKQPRPNILTPDDRKPCDRDKYLDCYALGTFIFHLSESNEPVYIRNGSLPGFTGSLVMNPKFGTVAFLGNSRNVSHGKEVTQSIEQAMTKGLILGE